MARWTFWIKSTADNKMCKESKSGSHPTVLGTRWKHYIFINSCCLFRCLKSVACWMETQFCRPTHVLCVEGFVWCMTFWINVSVVHQRESSDPEEERDEACSAAGFRIRVRTCCWVSDPRWEDAGHCGWVCPPDFKGYSWNMQQQNSTSAQSLHQQVELA